MMLLVAALLPVLAGGGDGAAGAVKLTVPQVQYRINEASASRSPWIDANGFGRSSANRTRGFYYDVPAKTARIGRRGSLRLWSARSHSCTDAAAFQRILPPFCVPFPEADISRALGQRWRSSKRTKTAGTGELMNLLTRRNLLFTGGKRRADPSTSSQRTWASKEEDLPTSWRNRSGRNSPTEKRLWSPPACTAVRIVIARLTGSRWARAAAPSQLLHDRPVVGLRRESSASSRTPASKPSINPRPACWTLPPLTALPNSLSTP